jgi:hypothetical protein
LTVFPLTGAHPRRDVDRVSYTLQLASKDGDQFGGDVKVMGHRGHVSVAQSLGLCIRRRVDEVSRRPHIGLPFLSGSTGPEVGWAMAKNVVGDLMSEHRPRYPSGHVWSQADGAIAGTIPTSVRRAALDDREAEVMCEVC